MAGSAASAWFRDHQESSPEDEDITIDIINENIHGFKIHDDCERLSNRFESQIREVRSQWKRKKHCGVKARETYLSNTRKIHIFMQELVDVKQIEDELCKVKTDLNHIRESNLYKLLQNCECGCRDKSNTGLKYDEVGRKSKWRKKKEFTNSAKSALWFANSYGLVPQSLQCVSHDGETVCVNFTEKVTKYDKLPESEKEKVRELVFVLDKLGVSDETYQQIHTLYPETPSRGIITECRNNHTPKELQRIPHGVKVASLKDEIKNMVESALQQNTWQPNDVFRVKFGGDGTRVSRISTFVSYSLSHVPNSNFSARDSHNIVAICKCSENYESLTTCFSLLFEEVNSLIKNPTVIITGPQGDMPVHLDICMCSDMKMINTLLGLKAAKYSCPWCLVKSENRHVIHDMEYYNKSPQKRNVDKDSAFNLDKKMMHLLRLMFQRWCQTSCICYYV